MPTSKNVSEKPYDNPSPATFLICAFSGWNDAGNAAIDAIDYFNRAYSAEPIPGFDVTAYYNFTETRPQLSHVGDTPIIEWPELSVHTFTAKEHRFITLTGPEPHVQWQNFTADFFSFAKNQGVDHIIMLGALLGENTHTRAFPVSITSYSPALQAAGVEVQSYSGPTGIVGVLAAFAGRYEFSDLSLWVAVPHYMGHAPQPKASYELLHQLGLIIDIPLDLTGLEGEKEAWERGAQELMDEEPDLAHYVQELEAQNQTETVTGDDIAAAFEQYLKGKDR